MLRAPRKIAGRGGVDPFVFSPPLFPAYHKPQACQGCAAPWLDLDRVQRVVIGRQGEGPAGVATSFCGSFSCWLFASPRCGGAKRQSKKQGAKTRALCRQAAGFQHTKRARASVERRSGDTKPAGRARSHKPTGGKGAGAEALRHGGFSRRAGSAEARRERVPRERDRCEGYLIFSLCAVWVSRPVASTIYRGAFP